MTHPNPLEHLLRMVERLAPTGHLGDGMRAEMQDCARRIRQRRCAHRVTETTNGVERCTACSWQRLVSAVDAARLARLEKEIPTAALEWSRATPTRCALERQGDEWACACGKRWGVDEAAPPCG